MSFLDRDYEQAASLAEQALDNFEHVEHLGIELAVRHTAAMARLLLGQPKEAAALLTQSGEKILGSGLDHADDHIWCVLHVASAIGASQSQPELAAQLLGAAETLFGESTDAVDREAAEHYRPLLNAARARLGDSTWQAAYTAGGNLTAREALGLIGRLQTPRPA